MHNPITFPIANFTFCTVYSRTPSFLVFHVFHIYALPSAALALTGAKYSCA